MRKVFLPLVMGAFCLSVGCESHETVEPAPVVAAAPIVPDRQDVFNHQKLSVVPLEARAAFERDQPGVAVTSVDLKPSETGPMLYKIVYVSDGKSYQVTYDGKGNLIIPPALPPELQTPRPGFPPQSQ